MSFWPYRAEGKVSKVGVIRICSPANPRCSLLWWGGSPSVVHALLGHPETLSGVKAISTVILRHCWPFPLFDVRPDGTWAIVGKNSRRCIQTTEQTALPFSVSLSPLPAGGKSHFYTGMWWSAWWRRMANLTKFQALNTCLFNTLSSKMGST